MKKAIIIHGWGATSKSNWFPWLAEKLEEQGFTVSSPDFPNSDYPILSEWLDFFKNNLSVDSNTILVGHSLGVPFILRILERLPKGKKIKAALLVAGFERSLGIPEIENFVDKPFGWKKIKSSCNRFFLINSDNDPYIPLSFGKDLANSLRIKLIVEHNGDHLSAPFGAFSYPRLLKLILSQQ